MGSLFRSEEMALCQLFLQSEAAYACVSELGELGLVQFRDLNPNVNAFQRKFVNEVRRCDEMERKIRYLEYEIRKEGIPMLETWDSPETPHPREIIDLEAAIDTIHDEILEVNPNAQTLKKNFLELTEFKQVLRKTKDLCDGVSDPQYLPYDVTPASDGGSRTSELLSCIGGAISRERFPAFERMLWRACHGYVFLRKTDIQVPLEDPVTSDHVLKSVFIIFIQGNELKNRVRKICEGFRAKLYPCPMDPEDHRDMMVGVMTRIQDLYTVLEQTQDHKHRILLAAAKNIKNWQIKIRKIQAIYHTLNLFNLDVTQKCFIAECWVPVLDLETIQIALRRGTDSIGSSMPPILNRMETKEPAPTFNRTNEFTLGFQSLINAYGVPSYGEVNPAPYTIVTFPFLFAIMFGDLGHGLLLALFGGYLVAKQKSLAAQQIKSDVWTIFFGGRYIIFLMGLFSMYTGLIYNDVFSKSLNIFGSHWQNNYNYSTLHHSQSLQMNPSSNAYLQHPYPIGLDPIWQLASNKIRVLNSYKMRISVIFGVFHMLFGVFMSLWNHVHFRNHLKIWAEFVPQVIFLCCLFMYMVSLIFIKWIIYGPMNDPKYGPHCAPSILITFINMVLFKSSKTQDGCDEFIYYGQSMLQKTLVIVAVLCIPVMLFVKPTVVLRQQKNQYQALIANDDLRYEDTGYHADDNSIQSGETLHAAHEPSHNAGEMFILQGIHTIEYVLGSVSHTASYLRLWALSLAHAQLSEVLWTMVMQNGFVVQNWFGGIMIFCMFAFWAVLTVAVLILMEGLSAFMHTLRLHWVEFQSKFYEGQGHVFHPFSFENILQVRDADE